MENIFKELAKPILIYCGVETQLDPFEKNVEVSMLNSLPIQAVVTTLTPTQAMWKMGGILVASAKEIIVKKCYKTLIEQSQKIQILGEDTLYEGWRVSGKLTMREEGEYLRLYIYSKTTE